MNDETTATYTPKRDDEQTLYMPDRELKARWVAALRSGEFEQGTQFFEYEGRYCCLGVLCEVAGVPALSESGCGNWLFVESLIDGPSLRLERLQPLTHRNDGASEIPRHTFDQIADYIEDNL